MEAYHSQTSPILDYYKKKNVLFTIDAMQKMPKVQSDIHNGLFETKYWDIWIS